jgi:hypothetical protein
VLGAVSAMVPPLSFIDADNLSKKNLLTGFCPSVNMLPACYNQQAKAHK